ncbi:mucin-17 [Strongylocentrotus purpuratus]|uniref:Uncharacterized protein n=1 Tax=Strongylocentrotus purpuratus TaxID=7668 RepID=A0A7M7GIR9_STRPU|nr:mucin-17 [Strongylocentrotus purpuratus]
MGSYQRITIVLILIVCLMGLSAGRGDGTASRSPIIEEEEELEIEYITVTVFGTTDLPEESNNGSPPPTRQNLTMVTPAPESTNETLATPQNVTPNVTPNVVPIKASQAPDSITTMDIDVVTDVGTGPSAMVGDGTGGGEELMMATQGLDVTSDGLDAATLPVAGDLAEEGTTEAIEVLTDILSIVTEETEDIITATDELPTSRQDADILPTIVEDTDSTTALMQEMTTASEILEPAVTSVLGEHPTTQFASTPEILTTVDQITSAPQSTPHTPLPPTTPESSTTAMLHTSLPPTTPELHTSLPPTTPESATTSMLHTSLPPATPERATTSMLHTSLPPTTPKFHTSLPPATPERATTSMLHTSVPTITTSQAQTTESDHTVSHHLNQISASDLSSDEIDNIVTLKFGGITVNSWYDSYDVSFRQYLSNMLTSVESSDIYYIRPTPLDQNDILFVSFIARSSSARKRSTKPVVPLGDVLGALDNITAFTEALGILPSQAPSITAGLPDFILDTLPTSPSFTLPVDGDDDDEDTTEESTRKPPPEIGFLSNPGLFISLVVIATVSIIIIIVGLIYLLCDRKRGRSGEYITNHTPRNSDLELGFDNPVMAENDKNVSNGNHLSSIKGEMESDMIVPYDNFTQEELMNYEVEDTHL